MDASDRAVGQRAGPGLRAGGRRAAQSLDDDPELDDELDPPELDELDDEPLLPESDELEEPDDEESDELDDPLAVDDERDPRESLR